MRSETEAVATREAMLNWIETHWNTLAALAWRGYVTEGRGIVLLQGDWHGEVIVAYQTVETARQAGAAWPDQLVAAVQDYTPATDIIFVVQRERTATVLGMRATPAQVAPREAGQRDGAPLLVPSA